MKKILFAAILICAAFGSKAQTAKGTVTDSAQLMQQQLLLPNRVIGKTNNGAVYALPQDGMPCFVPDSSAWTLMPIAKTGNFNPGAMPNPYKPNSLRNTFLESEKNIETGSFLKGTTAYPYKPQSLLKIITLPLAKATFTK
jgi:hypothetical protein